MVATRCRVPPSNNLSLHRTTPHRTALHLHSYGGGNILRRCAVCSVCSSEPSPSYPAIRRKNGSARRLEIHPDRASASSTGKRNSAHNSRRLANKKQMARGVWCGTRESKNRENAVELENQRIARMRECENEHVPDVRHVPKRSHRGPVLAQPSPDESHVKDVESSRIVVR